MTPTREQIIEGRDEALAHLHIWPFVFDRMTGPEQRRALDRAVNTELDKWAVITVAYVYKDDSIAWALYAAIVSLRRRPRDRQSDYALQA